MTAAIIGTLAVILLGVCITIWGLLAAQVIFGITGRTGEGLVCLFIACLGVALIWYGCHISPFSLITKSI